MRHQILKLTRGKSTKAERKFMEFLKGRHIKFRAKVKIKGREIDFIIGHYAIEIDSHLQNAEKNRMLVREGFIPVHLASWQINPKILSWIK